MAIVGGDEATPFPKHSHLDFLIPYAEFHGGESAAGGGRGGGRISGRSSAVSLLVRAVRRRKKKKKTRREMRGGLVGDIRGLMENRRKVQSNFLGVGKGCCTCTVDGVGPNNVQVTVPIVDFWLRRREELGSRSCYTNSRDVAALAAPAVACSGSGGCKILLVHNSSDGTG
ncbi:hypothetical protein Dimus_012078 [Dionaea muscipula]